MAGTKRRTYQKRKPLVVAKSDFNIKSYFFCRINKNFMENTLTPFFHKLYKKIYIVGLKTKHFWRCFYKHGLAALQLCATEIAKKTHLLPRIAKKHENFLSLHHLFRDNPKELARRMVIRLFCGFRLCEIDDTIQKKDLPKYRKAFQRRIACAGVWTVAVFTSIWAFQLAANYQIGVEVLIDGDKVCYINEQQQFLSVYSDVEDEITATTGETYALSSVPEYRLAFVAKNSTDNGTVIKTNLLKALDDEVTIASALSVDGKIIGINSDKDGMEQILSDLLAPYRSDDPNETVEFVKDVQIKTGLLPVRQMTTLFDLRDMLSQSTMQEQTYTVQPDDMVSSIAKKTGTTTTQLLQLNPNIQPEKINIGDQLIVEKAQPLLSVKVITTVEYKEAIPFETKKIETDTLYKNTSKVRQNGVDGEQLVRAEVCSIDGTEVNRTVIETQVLSEPVTKELLVGTKTPPKTAPTGSFRRPVSGGSITSRFGYRWGGEFHTGIDIAVHSGTSVVAADGGTVTFAGWSGNYGYIVKISHGNGIETWYAHNSKLLVCRGDKVYKGQVIAKSGSTGRSTGPHLHFEYRINGVPKNPAKYVSF